MPFVCKNWFKQLETGMLSHLLTPLRYSRADLCALYSRADPLAIYSRADPRSVRHRRSEIGSLLFACNDR